MTEDLKIQVPEANSPGVVRLCERLNVRAPKFVHFKEVIAGALPNFCYQNVDFVASKFGGCRVDGWAFWQYEDFFVEAEHHAVWQKRGGELLCVTPQECDTDGLLFCLDGAPKYEGRRIEKHREILRCHTKVAAFVSAMDALNQLRYEAGDRQMPAEEFLRSSKLGMALKVTDSALKDLLKERPTSRYSQRRAAPGAAEL